jgi:hypothetical protein
MKRSPVKKSTLVLAAIAMAFAPLAPAFAGGRHHNGHSGSRHYASGHHYSGHHYSGRQYYGGGHYYGSRHYRGRHHHGGLSGGEAALLAAGIIGGVILIDRALENDRDRAYADSYDPYRGDRYVSREPSRDFYYRRDDRAYGAGDDDFSDNRALEGELAGGGQSGAGYNYGAAYNDCKAETRDAAGDSGLLVALPARPRVIDPIDDGAAVRFTADILARDINGAEYRRVMTCEADSEGVRFLELA